MFGDPGGHRGHLYEVRKVYGDPRGVIRGHLFEVWEVFGALGGHRVSFV